MMKKLINFISSYLNLNQICIAIFLIIYIGFYYADYLTYINLSYCLLFFACILNFLKQKRFKYFKFIIISLVFGIYSLSSSIWAEDSTFTYISSLTLFKSIFISILFINLLDNIKDIKIALFSLCIGGLIYAFIYTCNVDISSLGDGRITTTDTDTDLLPNVNIVSLFLIFSYIYFIFYYFFTNRIVFGIFAIISFIFLIILGARKSIISILICLFLISLKLKRNTKIKLVFIITLSLILIYFIIPKEYLDFIYERLMILNFFTDNTAALSDSGDDIRITFIEYGVEYFNQSPLIGHGYYSFRSLFGNDTGIFLYSHNNFIETVVGGGLIAIILYYSIYYTIIKNTWTKNICYDHGYLIFIFIIILLFNHFSIVLLNERFIWILLAILWVASYKYKLKKF